MVSFHVFAKPHSRRSFDFFSRPTTIPRPPSPNSPGIISFTDPHPLTPVVSYRYKNIGGGTFLALQTFNLELLTFDLLHSSPLFSLFYTLFSATGLPQPFVYQSLPHSFHRDGGCGVPPVVSTRQKGEPSRLAVLRPSHRPAPTLSGSRVTSHSSPATKHKLTIWIYGFSRNDRGRPAQYAIGPTSFSTSAISTMTMASHGQPSRKQPSGPLLRHFLHPMHWMGSIWMRPNGGLSSSGTQNMQSSTGQYSTQAGDPAQPVQHSVITASSFGFFLRAVEIPLERGSCFSSSGTIPGALTTSGALAISCDSTLNVKPLSVWFLPPVPCLLQCPSNPIHLRSHTCSPRHSSNISHRLCSPDSHCASSSSGISPSLPEIPPITKSLPATGSTIMFTVSTITASFFPRMSARPAIRHSWQQFTFCSARVGAQSCSRKPSLILEHACWPPELLRASPTARPMANATASPRPRSGSLHFVLSPLTTPRFRSRRFWRHFSPRSRSLFFCRRREWRSIASLRITICSAPQKIGSRAGSLLGSAPSSGRRRRCFLQPC